MVYAFERLAYFFMEIWINFVKFADVVTSLFVDLRHILLQKDHFWMPQQHSAPMLSNKWCCELIISVGNSLIHVTSTIISIVESIFVRLAQNILYTSRFDWFNYDIISIGKLKWPPWKQIPFYRENIVTVDHSGGSIKS